LIADAFTWNLNFLEPRELIPICVDIAFNTQLHSSSAGEMEEKVVQITGDPVIRKGDRGPTMSHVFLYFLVVSLFVDCTI